LFDGGGEQLGDTLLGGIVISQRSGDLLMVLTHDVQSRC